MTASERAAFLAERQTGIGGSDIASLLQPYLSEVKYGCRRRLWYEKSGVPADYPQDDSGPMQLGRILEPHIARWHEEATGDTLSTPETIRHPKHPELLVHIDRTVVTHTRREPGVAEIKALGPDMFYQTKRQGILPDYALQVQHGLLCSGLKWGRYIVGNRAYGHSVKNPPLAWDVEGNPDIHKAILDEGPAFWTTLGDEARAPARLDPDDKRCASCNWRTTCQGGALIATFDGDLEYAEDLRPLLVTYDEVKARFPHRLADGSLGSDDDLAMETIKNRIRETLDARQAVAVAQPSGTERKVYYRQQPGKISWEDKALVVAYERARLKLRAELQSEAEIEQFDTDFPAALTFKRQGLPYRTLRIF